MLPKIFSFCFNIFHVIDLRNACRTVILPLTRETKCFKNEILIAVNSNTVIWKYLRQALRVNLFKRRSENQIKILWIN